MENKILKKKNFIKKIGKQNLKKKFYKKNFEKKILEKNFEERVGKKLWNRIYTLGMLPLQRSREKNHFNFFFILVVLPKIKLWT